MAEDELSEAPVAMISAPADDAPVKSLVPSCSWLCSPEHCSVGCADDDAVVPVTGDGESSGAEGGADDAVDGRSVGQTKCEAGGQGMAAANEPPQEEAVDPALLSRANRLYFHMWANIVGICLLLQARPMLLATALGGDKVLLAKRMGQISAGVGVLELFLNPIAGQLSDKFGRRPLIVVAPFVNFVNKMLVALHPSLFMLAWERIVDGAVTTLSGSTTCAAALSDMFSGDTLGLAFAKLGSAAGVGALTGSMLSGRLLSAGVRPTTIFKLTALLGLCQGAIDLYCLQETLPEEKKSTKPLTMPNPLSALRLLEGSRGLKTLVAVAILQCMPEGKNLSDALTTYQSNDVGMTPVDRANFVAAFGSSMMFGGALAKYTIALFGDRGHTTFSNVFTMVAMTIWGLSSRLSAAWIGLFFLLPTMERRCVTSAMATDLAVSEGWNKGEYAAAFANVRALTVISAPLLYANSYAAFSRRGTPGYVFLVAGAIVAIAEGLHRSISDAQCRPVKKELIKLRQESDKGVADDEKESSNKTESEGSKKNAN